MGIVYVAECKNGYITEAEAELNNMEWKSVDEVSELNIELWT